MSSSRTRRILLPVIIVVLALVVTVVLIRIRPKPARRPATAPRPVVEAYTVGDTVGTVRIQGFGPIRAKRKVNLTPRVEGEIVMKSDRFEPGAVFQAGETLMQIDDTDYALALAQAEANVAQAEYNLERAEEEAQVSLDAWKRTETTEASPLVRHEPQLKLARASLAAARAAVRQARLNLDRCTVTAPFDGMVIRADSDEGQYLRAGTAVGVIIATDVAEVTVPVADSDLGWIRVGTESTTPTSVTVRADFAGRRHQWAARLVRVGGAVDERSRQIPVVIEIDAPFLSTGERPALIEGMFVQVEFATEPAGDTVVIPRSALRPENHIWVIRDDNTLDIRTVELARAGVDEAVIRQGIRPGERLCVSNMQFVTQGLPIRVEGETSPEGAGKTDRAAKGGKR